jgi:hypothetical protein
VLNILTEREMRCGPRETVSHPNNCQGPAAPHEQEDATDDSQHADEGNQEDLVIERSMRSWEARLAKPVAMNRQPRWVTRRGRFMGVELALGGLTDSTDGGTTE